MRGALSRVLQIAAITFTLALVPYLAIQSKAFDRDPDIWWHIRAGDWIAQHHALPRFAIFSQYSERPWTDYSWAFDLMVSGIHAVFGLPGIPGLLVCLEILISLTFLLSIQRIGARFWWSWWIATAGIIAFYINPPRPGLFTLLFFTLELLLIFEAERTGDDKLLWWMGPLFMFWVNCHIQFVYGVAVLGLYIASRILSLKVRRLSHGVAAASASVLKLAGIFGVGVVGSCIGPNGWLPYKVALGLASQTYVYQIIQEMSAMNFRRPEHYAELLLVMAACFALGRSRRRDLFRPALLVMTAVVSFRSLRDMWFAAIAAAFVIAEVIRETASSPPEDDRALSSASKWQLVAYSIATVLALAHSFAYGIGHGITTSAMIADIDRVYPIQATEFVRDSHLKGPMYNSFNWGGFLMFNLPDEPVSIDPRTNVYGDDVLKREMATIDGANWQSDPDLARAHFVLIERYLPLAAELAKASGYRLVYQDPLALVFVKQPTAQTQ
jgi:hypothetical protein